VAFQGFQQFKQYVLTGNQWVLSKGCVCVACEGVLWVWLTGCKEVEQSGILWGCVVCGGLQLCVVLIIRSMRAVWL